MKYLLSLNLVVAVLLMIGCKSASFGSSSESVSFGSESEYEPNPEWSEERNQFAIEERQLKERMHQMREFENEDSMRQYGYPKY